MRHTLEALLLLAGRTLLRREVPNSKLPEALPTRSHFNKLKQTDPGALRSGLIDVVTSELKPLVQEAETLGVLDRATNAPSTFSAGPEPTNLSSCGDNPRSWGDVTDWDRRIALRAGPRTLVEQVGSGATPASIVDGFLATTQPFTGAKQMRIALDVLGRWVAAKRAALTFGGSDDTLAIILALYRIEGDFSVPRSTRSLQALVPAEPVEGIQPSLAIDGNRRLQLGWNSIVMDPASRQSLDAEVLRNRSAILGWLVHVGGHDRFVASGPGPAALARFAGFWSAALATGSMDAAGLTSRLNTVIGDFTIEHAETDAGLLETSPLAAPGSRTKLIRSSPGDPIEVVQIALELAFALFDNLSRVRTFAPAADATLRWSPDATYLLYNNQIQAVRTEKRIPDEAILGSAAGSAARPTGYRPPTDPVLDSKFAPLRQSLRNVELSDASGRRRLANPGPLSAARVAEENGPVLKHWLSFAPNLTAAETRADLLSFFVAHAGDGQWSGFQEHRCNVSRFRLLHAYYRHALGLPPA